MANPAQLLLERFNEWNGATNVAAEMRRHISEDPEWVNQRIAVRHLDAIDQLLDELAASGRNVAVFRRQFPEWCRVVFAYPRGWQGQSTAPIDRTARDHLENLADRLEDFVPTVQLGGLDALRDYAKLVSETLVADTSLPAPLCAHANEVVSHLLWCIDNYEIVGDFDLGEAVERLAATVVRVASASDQENLPKWHVVINGFVWPFAINVLAAIPSAGLTQLALPQ